MKIKKLQLKKVTLAKLDGEKMKDVVGGMQDGSGMCSRRIGCQSGPFYGCNWVTQKCHVYIV